MDHPALCSHRKSWSNQKYLEGVGDGSGITVGQPLSIIKDSMHTFKKNGGRLFECAVISSLYIYSTYMEKLVNTPQTPPLDLAIL